MKDIVANRSKISLAQKARLLRIVLRENGFLWTTSLGLYYSASLIADRAFVRMNQLRAKHNLPGINSATMNYEIWRNWDWSSSGEEWTESVEWKNSLVNNVLVKHMQSGGDILEIGPGAGAEPKSCSPWLDISSLWIFQTSASIFVGRNLTAALMPTSLSITVRHCHSSRTIPSIPFGRSMCSYTSMLRRSKSTSGSSKGF